VCTHHNVESSLLARRADVERPWYRSAYMRMQSRLMRREEDEHCPDVAMNVLCSEADLQLLRSHSPTAPGAVVPNGIDVDEFRPVDGPSAGVVFVGGTSWFPNLDALEYFAGDIYPRILARAPECPATWVGAASAPEQARFGALGIRLTGYVEDVRPYIAGARVFVVPLRAGGGTRLKILTAWSMASAVVTTSIGCEGLDAVDGVNCLIRDDPEAFADAVIRVSQDADLRRALGAAARATAERTYSWSVIGQQMVSLYERVIASSAKAGA
jgi:glycosyltransferase involved in cell wall biosynthesis